MKTRHLIASIALTAALPSVCLAEDKVVNVYNWSDYIGAGINDRFSKETGVAVQYDIFDSAEIASTKLLIGNSGYDVVVTGGGALTDLIKAGALMKLDKARLPFVTNLDANVLKAGAAYDPGNTYAVPYFWGTTGIGYNAKKIAERAAGAPLDSLALILDPAWTAKFSDCGIAMLDTPEQVFPIVLNYLSLDPHTESPDDYAKAKAVIEAIRPYVRYFHSSRYVNDIANGDICLALGWSGDFFIAGARAAEAKNNVDVRYSIPREGTMVWVDNFAIPVDAPHADNAHAYVNFMLDPDVAATNAAEIHTASPNTAALATGKIPAEDLSNQGIYPPSEVMTRLFGEKAASQDLKRLRTRMWTAVVSGR